MARDLKYGNVSTERGSVRDDEPVFVIRAQDAASIDTIISYFSHAEDIGADAEFLAQGAKVVDEFGAWQEANADKVKVPDGVPAAVVESNVKQVEICKADRNRMKPAHRWPEDEERWYFNEIAGNGEVVGTSELYNTKGNAKRAAQDKNPTAEIVEEDEGE